MPIDRRLPRTVKNRLAQMLADLRTLPGGAAGSLTRVSDDYDGLRYIDSDDGTTPTYLPLPSEGRVLNLLETREAVNVLDYRQAADGDDIAPAVLRAITRAGSRRKVNLPSGDHNWRSHITVTSAFYLVGDGANIIPDLTALISGQALIKIDYTGQTIEDVRVQGIRSDGRGYYGKFLWAWASGAGRVRDIQLVDCKVTGYQADAFILGECFDPGAVVEGIYAERCTGRNLGFLSRVTATGASGSTTLTLTTRDQFALGLKARVGLRLQLAGGAEKYQITAFDAATGQATISPALTRAVTDAWVYGLPSTLPNASGTAGQATVTLASATHDLVPGALVGFGGCRGMSTVQAVNGATLTLTAPLQDTFATQATYSGWTEAGLFSPYWSARRGTFIGNVGEGLTGDLVQVWPSTTRDGDGDWTFIGNTVRYARMAFEQWTLSGYAGKGWVQPTLAATAAAATTLGLSNTGTMTPLATQLITVGALIAVENIPGTYRVTAVAGDGASLDISRMDLISDQNVGGGLAEAVTGTTTKVFLVRDATGKNFNGVKGSRGIFIGNTVDELVRASGGGYAISWSGEMLTMIGNNFRSTQRALLESNSRYLHSSGNNWVVRDASPGRIGPRVAADDATLLMTSMYLQAESGQMNDTWAFEPSQGTAAQNPGRSAVLAFYPRGSFPYESDGVTFSGRVRGFKRLNAYLGPNRTDNVVFDRFFADAPDATDQWGFIQGRGWRVRGGSTRMSSTVTGGSRVWRLPGVANFADAAMDFEVSGHELRGDTPLLGSDILALTAGAYRLRNNIYLRAAGPKYDAAADPAKSGYILDLAADLKTTDPALYTRAVALHGGAVGDGLGGLYRWVADSTGAEDTATYNALALTASPATGRWARVTPSAPHEFRVVETSTALSSRARMTLLHKGVGANNQTWVVDVENTVAGGGGDAKLILRRMNADGSVAQEYCNIDTATGRITFSATRQIFATRTQFQVPYGPRLYTRSALLALSTADLPNPAYCDVSDPAAGKGFLVRWDGTSWKYARDDSAVT